MLGQVDSKGGYQTTSRERSAVTFLGLAPDRRSRYRMNVIASSRVVDVGLPYDLDALYRLGVVGLLRIMKILEEGCRMAAR